MMRELRQVKDKSYRQFPLGQEVGRFLRYLKVEGKAQATLTSYETVLAALTIDHADLEITDFQERGGGDLLIDFLDQRWGTSSRETLHHRVAVLRSFFGWALRTGRIERDPTIAIRTPKRTRVVRFVPPADLVAQIVSAQPLRDQAGLLCMARLAFRRDELRRARIRDFDLTASTVAIYGKGGHVDRIPFGEYRDVSETLYLHIVGEGREPDEHLVYPKSARLQPFSQVGIHFWFKRCLERAGVEDFPMHALRHAAIDEMRRRTGNIEAARQLARHASIATTEAYLHADTADLIEAMRQVERGRGSV